MKAPYGIWMLASRIWQRWPNAREALWMNFWIMFTTCADRLAWTTTSPSSRPGSLKEASRRDRSDRKAKAQKDGLPGESSGFHPRYLTRSTFSASLRSRLNVPEHQTSLQLRSPFHRGRDSSCVTSVELVAVVVTGAFRI